MRNQQKYWSQKTVLITGASSGLGWALVQTLAPFQVKFCLLSRRENKMRELAQQLKNSGSSFWIKTCDVRDRQQVFTAIQAFHQTTGSLDVAWINSGVSISSAVEDWEWQNIENMLDTNLKGAIYTTQACLEIMGQQSSGCIVGIGSASCMRGLPRRGIYSLTKIGLEYFLMSKAAELPHLQFSILHPGFVDTPINADSENRFWLLTPEKAANIMIRAVANGRKFFVFPVRMAMLFRFMRYLPYPVYQWIARKTLNISRPSKRS